ncbi:hypothetical protein MYCTH_2107294 [Thermothelomyces thermophilus ATCC 42464]|uniref:Uncharacterized protein n=1 Tax=Thermothelomyces thermophilus (strain ATCC 42464 / BCRC 31852 / DSM 1799) TaxID=573729 RepID=G2Q534_THET4|nr:uncharacterized protein MYCTH_2107294 [Thermothelomyces thermophilus ATCC 42464]AEO54572.1 hypothetical protein MYCTH_2107294 [Thermothelomyces thermophilus ATCC 42464]
MAKVSPPPYPLALGELCSYLLKDAIGVSTDKLKPLGVYVIVTKKRVTKPWSNPGGKGGKGTERFGRPHCEVFRVLMEGPTLSLPDQFLARSNEEKGRRHRRCLITRYMPGRSLSLLGGTIVLMQQKMKQQKHQTKAEWSSPAKITRFMHNTHAHVFLAQEALDKPTKTVTGLAAVSVQEADMEALITGRSCLSSHFNLQYARERSKYPELLLPISPHR